MSGLRRIQTQSWSLGTVYVGFKHKPGPWERRIQTQTWTLGAVYVGFRRKPGPWGKVYVGFKRKRDPGNGLRRIHTQIGNQSSRSDVRKPKTYTPRNPPTETLAPIARKVLWVIGRGLRRIQTQTWSLGAVYVGFRHKPGPWQRFT